MLDAATVLPLSGWESFYVIAGSSAAALTGLSFVVITLGAEIQRTMPAAAVRTFTTPTIVHFCIVLLMSAILSAPWQSVHGAAVCLVVTAVTGLAYGFFITWSASHQEHYKPVLEDWVFHSALPVIAYGALLVASILLPRYVGPMSFVIAGVSLMLLFIGIHNAWDTVIWMAVTNRNREDGANAAGTLNPQSASAPPSAAPARSGQGSPVG